MRFNLTLILALFVCWLPTAALAAGELPMQVADIRVEGLQRLPVERVYSNLGIQPGDTISRANVVSAIRRLYAVGDFEDVQLGRGGRRALQGGRAAPLPGR